MPARKIIKWHTIHQPTGGLYLDLPSDFIKETFTPDCEEVVFREGMVSKAPGTQIYAQTDTYPLDGSVLRLIQFTRNDLTIYLIALTTERAYKYNVTDDIFDDITRLGSNLVSQVTVRANSSVNLVARLEVTS